MNVELITKQDLEEFRMLLLQEIKEIVSESKPKLEEYIGSNEVRKILNNMAPSTLQYHREHGNIAYRKAGAKYMYSLESVQEFLKRN